MVLVKRHTPLPRPTLRVFGGGAPNCIGVTDLDGVTLAGLKGFDIHAGFGQRARGTFYFRTQRGGTEHLEADVLFGPHAPPPGAYEKIRELEELAEAVEALFDEKVDLGGNWFHTITYLGEGEEIRRCRTCGYEFNTRNAGSALYTQHFPDCRVPAVRAALYRIRLRKEIESCP